MIKSIISKMYLLCIIFIVMTSYNYCQKLIIKEVSLDPEEELEQEKTDRNTLVISIGYGKLDVGIGDFAVFYNEAGELESFDFLRSWDFYEAEIGFILSKTGTHLNLQLMRSQSKDNNIIGRRALMGGGYTNVYESTANWGAFFGVRQKLLWVIYGQAGIGYIEQSNEKHYDKNVYNSAAGFIEASNVAWYFGASVNFYENIMLGIKSYHSPKIKEEEDMYMEGLVFQASLML